MSVFQEDVAIESDGETLQDSDEWALYDDSDGLDSDDEESNDLSFESDEHNGEVAEHNVSRFKIQSDSTLRVAERNEIDDDKIAIEQGKKIMATYADKPAEDIDPLWLLPVFPESTLLSKWPRTFCRKRVG